MKLSRNILYRFPKSSDPFDICVSLISNTTYLCVKASNRWRYFQFSGKSEYKEGTLAQPISTHTHASDAQGGQLDWDNIWTDAVHSHASNGEGGQLDWDNVWSDAVHSHQSNAEGGTLDHGAALTGLTDDDHTQYSLADGTRAFSGTVTTQAGRIVNVTRVTTTYTILATDHHIFCDTDGAAFTVTLPTGVAGTEYRIVNVGSSGNTLTIAPNGAELLLGVNSNFSLFDGESLHIVYETTEGWY